MIPCKQEVSHIWAGGFERVWMEQASVGAGAGRVHLGSELRCSAYPGPRSMGALPMRLTRTADRPFPCVHVQSQILGHLPRSDKLALFLTWALLISVLVKSKYADADNELVPIWWAPFLPAKTRPPRHLQSYCCVNNAHVLFTISQSEHRHMF